MRHVVVPDRLRTPSNPQRNTAIEMPRKLQLPRLVVALSVVVPMIWSAAASASVSNCSYRNLTHGAVPYVAQVRTNLTSAAVDGANVCRVVSQVARHVQLRGFDLGAAQQLIDTGESWALDHHLVYPRGWPKPTGPVYDPHMQVTLRMLARGPAQQGQPVPTGASHTSAYWIELNEYT
jgi:hypothetical protein